MQKSGKILSDIIVHQKYAKYLPELQRRETWDEIVDRNMDMHIKAYPFLRDDIVKAHDLVRQRKVVPSMRSLQFAGKAIEIAPNRLYNCCFLPIESAKSFSETMYNLLSGTGVGFSVQNYWISKLPTLKKVNPNEEAPRYLIQDSIIGWSEAIRVLMEGIFQGKRWRFDFRDIREKGSRLVTSGGKAPGPEPLKECINRIVELVDRIIAERGETALTSVEVHDIECFIADAVLAGGIRRAAMISLFDNDDELMLYAKSGDWYINNLQRSRANNSAVLVRGLDGYDEFNRVFDVLQQSGAGEPGFIWTNSPTTGTNPCAEISLEPYQFCNLTEVNCNGIETETDFLERIWAATFIGTLQAAQTDFTYLRPIWKETTRRDALLGVSLTGAALLEPTKWDWTKLTDYSKLVNADTANRLGINPASRLLCLKPSGTASLVLGTPPGIHAGHSPFYRRNIRVNNSESIATHLQIFHPELIAPDDTNPTKASVITIPQKLEPGVTLRTEETALQFLERVKFFTENWIWKGYRVGTNHHNISATITVNEDEWDDVRVWMWTNRDYYNGLSIMPFFDATGGDIVYTQLPYEEIDEEEYERLMAALGDNFDPAAIVELEDHTDLAGEVACGGGGCELTSV